MPRPKRKRIVTAPPVMEGFKPFGVPISDLEPIVLFYEEYESIRLLDYLGMTQLEAAKEMAVSRPTLTRIYEKARRAIAEAFVEGKAIFIGGGDYHTDEFWYRCDACFKLMICDDPKEVCSYCSSDKIKPLSKMQVQQKQQQREDEPVFCICMDCNTRLPHTPGIPCWQNSCPQCGKDLIRENSYHHQLYLQKKERK